MANYALLTAHGKDRPGIVAAIARVLLDCGCNIEDSQMARLGPDFACMLALRMPEGLLSERIEQKLASTAQGMGLWLRVHDLLPEEAAATQAEPARHLIEARGADQKGIVFRITGLLAERGVNISSMHTEVLRQPVPLYAMRIQAELPPFVDAQVLERELADAGREIGVTVTVQQLPAERGR